MSELKYSKEDMDLMRACFEKYQNYFGYITFYNHIQAHIDFMVKLPYRIGEKNFNKEEFELNKKAMIEAFTIVKEIAQLHKMQGIPVKVDLEGL